MKRKLYLELMDWKENDAGRTALLIDGARRVVLQFMRKFREETHIPYVLHTSDLKEDEGILFLPLYMTPLL